MEYCESIAHLVDRIAADGPNDEIIQQCLSSFQKDFIGELLII
jgi:hypothetical protein